ncbi:hypothetical protein MTP99_000692 [Tenebrio molitor]|jgi:hypothetical protein|nr:hypothetical protein MTP99_000692 [Tenebrio molitor]
MYNLWRAEHVPPPPPVMKLLDRHQEIRQEIRNRLADFLAGNAATRVKVIVFYRDVILNLERDKAPVSASINNEKLQRCAAAAAAARGVERLADPPSLARKDIHLEAQPPEDELQKRFLFGCSILRFSGGTFSKNEKENA